MVVLKRKAPLPSNTKKGKTKGAVLVDGVVFSVGEKVECCLAMHKGKHRYYPGIVTGADTVTRPHLYGIKYDDGEVVENVPGLDIRAFKEYKANDLVMCYFLGTKENPAAYYPRKIYKVLSETTYLIVYDDQQDSYEIVDRSRIGRSITKPKAFKIKKKTVDDIRDFLANTSTIDFNDDLNESGEDE
jgi:hypothetical protein